MEIPHTAGGYFGDYIKGSDRHYVFIGVEKKFLFKGELRGVKCESIFRFTNFFDAI